MKKRLYVLFINAFLGITHTDQISLYVCTPCISLQPQANRLLLLICVTSSIWINLSWRVCAWESLCVNTVYSSTSPHALSLLYPHFICFSSLINDSSPQRHVLFIIHERVTGGVSFIKGSCSSDKIRLIRGCWSLFIPVTWLQRAGTPHPFFPAPTR